MSIDGVRFVLRCRDGMRKSVEKGVKAFLDGIQSAAQLLWADICIQKRLLPTVAPVMSQKGERRKKAL